MRAAVNYICLYAGVFDRREPYLPFERRSGIAAGR
jgi:hypothetical protein